MSIVKREEFQTEEGKAKIDKWFKDFIKDCQKQQEEINEIVSNADYISWIENYTKQTPMFTNCFNLYLPDETPEKERKNKEKLELFFKAIRSYAEKNYIYPKLSNSGLGCFYLIRHNGVSYKIGILEGQEIIYVCELVDIRKFAVDFLNFPNTINFSDILNDKKQERTDFISNRLKMLSDLIYTISSENVPLEAIDNCVKTVLNDIKNKEK